MRLDSESEHQVHQLLKDATAQKKSGDWKSACQTLRNAYEISIRGGVLIEIKSRLRLPKYLAESGHRDQAWAEFNAIMSEVLSYRPTEWAIAIDLEQVEREMAKFLSKEQRYRDAFFHSVLSLHWTIRWNYHNYLDAVHNIDRYRMEAANATSDSMKSRCLQFVKFHEEDAEKWTGYYSGLKNQEVVEEFIDDNLKEREFVDKIRPKILQLFNREFTSFPDVQLSNMLDELTIILRDQAGLTPSA